MSELDRSATEEIFCNTCHNEFIFDLKINEEIAEEEIQFCPLCGGPYNQEMDINDLNFDMGDPESFFED